MKVASGYTPIQSTYPLKGLATSPPSNQLPSALSPNLIDVHVRDGIVQRRSGYLKIGQTLNGVVLGITEFAPIGLADRLIILTSTTQYFYDDTNDIFVDISREETTTHTITDAYATPIDVITVDNDVGDQFPVGSNFVIVGSTANDGTYTVLSTALVGGDTEITIAADETLADSTVDGDVISTTLDILTDVYIALDIFEVAGNQTARYPVGQTFFCRSSTGNNGTYTVLTSTVVGGGTEIAVNEDITDATVDGHLTVRDELSTAETDLIDYEPLVDISGKRLLMTNGLDNPQQWTGVTGTNPDHFFRWSPNFINFVTCKWIKVFKEHLHLGNILTSIDEPQLIAWSDSGVFDDFTNGNAAAQILYELTTGIQALENLGDRMIVYSRDAIASGIFVGGTAIFQFETIIPEGTRLAGANGIVSINVGHVYASEENFYLFDGTRGLRTLGDIIRTEYKEVKDQEFLHRAIIFNDFSKRTLYISIPDSLSTSGVSSSIVYTMEYNAFDMAERAWSKEQYADAPRAFGFYTNTITFTWEDTDAETALAVVLGRVPPYLQWGDELGSWGNEGEQVNFPVRTFGDASGNVYLAADSVLTDNGVSQTGHYETADAWVPEEFISSFGRWGEIEFEASGTVVAVHALTDLGSVTTVVDAALTLDGAFLHYRLPIDITARTLRVRFEFTGSFKLRWIKVWVKPVAAR